MEKLQGQRTQTGDRRQIHRHEPNKQEGQSEGQSIEAAIAAMLLSAGTAQAAQLADDTLLRAAGAVGNPTMLAWLEQTESGADPAPYAARLGGGEIPSFEQAPRSEVRPAPAFAPTAVPSFGLATEAATFDAVAGMMPTTL